MSAYFLETKQLTKAFGKQLAVDHVSIRVKDDLRIAWTERSREINHFKNVNGSFAADKRRNSL